MRGAAAYCFRPNVPTVAMRQGGFHRPGGAQESVHGSFPVQRKYHSGAVPQRPGAPTAEPLPANGRISERQRLTAANYRASFDGPEVHRTEEIRLDHSFTTRNMAFVRYENRKDDYQIPGARSSLPPSPRGPPITSPCEFLDAGGCPHFPAERGQRIPAGVVILVSASSSNLDGQSLMQQIGIGGLPSRGYTNSLPYFSISGVTGNAINLLTR